MTLSRFRWFSARKKLAQALGTGTYLLQRSGKAGPVSLYHLPDNGKGFFVEVAYDAALHRPYFLRSFRRPRRLAAYVAGVALPAG